MGFLVHIQSDSARKSVMTHETADWVNRIGMILGFLSFWFAAPEFIGEKRLQSWESALGRSLPKAAGLTEAAGKSLMQTWVSPAIQAIYVLWNYWRGGWVRKTVLTLLSIGAFFAGIYFLIEQFVHPAGKTGVQP